MQIRNILLQSETDQVKCISHFASILASIGRYRKRSKRYNYWKENILFTEIYRQLYSKVNRSFKYEQQQKSLISKEVLYVYYFKSFKAREHNYRLWLQGGGVRLRQEYSNSLWCWQCSCSKVGWYIHCSFYSINIHVHA